MSSTGAAYSQAFQECVFAFARPSLLGAGLLHGRFSSTLRVPGRTIHFLPIPYSVARDCWTHIGFVYA